ncbi:unnamed protein product [Ectocarpus sp. 8 AP-2014]
MCFVPSFFVYDGVFLVWCLTCCRCRHIRIVCFVHTVVRRVTIGQNAWVSGNSTPSQGSHVGKAPKFGQNINLRSLHTHGVGPIVMRWFMYTYRPVCCLAGSPSASLLCVDV